MFGWMTCPSRTCAWGPTTAMPQWSKSTLPGAVIGKGAKVSYAIIGEGCRIGENAVVGGAPGITTE